MSTEFYEVRFNERIDYLPLEDVQFLLTLEKFANSKTKVHISLKDGRELNGTLLEVTAKYSQLSPNQVDIPLRFVYAIEGEKIELLYFEIKSFEEIE